MARSRAKYNAWGHGIAPRSHVTSRQGPERERRMAAACSKNRVALITGGSRGLGLAIAGELARRGFDLFLAARGEESLRTAADKLRPSRVEWAAGDVSHPEAAEGAARSCRAAYGRLDLLVNNAGIFLMGSLEEFRPESWERILAVNLTAPFLLTRACLSLLKESRGQIVFINSVGGRVGLKNLSGYSASKFGLRGLADSVRLELKPAGIRVTSVYPHGMNSAGDPIPEEDPRRWTQIETTDVARMVGEVADAPAHLQIPEIVLYPRSTEVGKQETDTGR